MWIAKVRSVVVGTLATLLTASFPWVSEAQPQITNLAPADGSLLSSRTGTLTGVAPGASLLRVDGVDQTLAADGSFSYAFDLPEGESALSIYAEDAGGATSLVHHLEVDTLAPGIVITAPAQVRVGASPVEVAGTVQDPHLQGVTVRGSPASLAGNSFSASVSLNEGAQNVAIVATDSLGHSSTVTLVITLDTQAPTINVTEGGSAWNGGLYDRPLTPQIAISDASTYTSEILLDGASYVAGTAISAEGAHLLEISATDAVGNTASRQIAFTLDFTAPTFTSVAPAAGSLLASSSVTLQVEALGATLVKVGSVVGNAAGNLYTIGPITLSEGEQELLIEAVDAAGNRAERRHALVRDTTAPTLQITAPAQNAVLTTSPVTVHGQALDPRLTSVRVGGELAGLSGSSFSIEKTLVEGANVFLVEATDSAGNTTSQNLNVTLDSTAPTFTVKVNGVVLQGGEVYSTSITPTIEVSEPTATVTATLDGAAYSFGTAISSDGNHQLAVTVSHNGLSSSNLFAFRIDRQAPVFENVSPASGTVLAATTVLLEGRLEHAVSLTVDGVAVPLQGEVFAAGPFNLTAGGSRTFVLVATSAGGLTTQHQVSVVQDGTAPQLTIQQPTEGALVGTATTSFSGMATDPHLLRVRVAGVEAQVSASTYFVSAVSLAEGSNSLTVVAEDRAGNVSQLTRTVVRDSTDPEVTITEPVAGTVVPGASYTVRGTATDAHLDRVEVNGRRANLVQNQFSLAINLVEGANSIEVVAIDRLGRRKSATVTITRDSAAPQVTIQDPEENAATQLATITVRGAYENEAGTTVKVNGLVAVLTNGFFEVAVPLVPGVNRLTARATDAQGNEGVHTRTITRDQVAPTWVRLDPASGALALPLSTVFRLTFSEEMAAPVDGAISLTTAAGAPLLFSVVVQGNDLVLTPQSPLPAQTSLRLTLSAALRDRAGNALAPVPATFEFTTTDTAAPGAPVVAPIAAAACRSEVTLTGTTEALSQVRVEGGAAAALTRANEAGAFSLVVALRPEELNVLHVTAIDSLGNTSPETVIETLADCTPPRVTEAVLTGTVVQVSFSEEVEALVGAFSLSSPAGNEPFAFAANLATATLTLPSAPAGLLELAIAGGTGVTDLAGNALAFPFRQLFGAGAGDSFLAGTVFDDAKGQPLPGVLVSVTSTNGVQLGNPLPQQTTAADGRFLLGLPAGTHDVTFARPGYAPVFRVVTTATGEGTRVFAPRLTLLNLPTAVEVGGGEVVAGEASLTVPAGALSQPQATSLTVLSEQALPALLPYGFSPRGAVYLDIDATFAQPATLMLPVATANGRQVVIASLDFGLLQWRAIEVRTVSGPTLDLDISAPGAYVVVEADPESTSLLTAVPGQVLPSLPAPTGNEVVAADIDFSPSQVLPSQRSLATVGYTLANAGVPAPSGMPLTVAVQERLTLLDGSERRAVPYSADLLVFRSPSGEPRSLFWLQPSELASSLPIELGAEEVSVRTFGETSVRGNILGPDGGSVLGLGGDVFDVPAGALSRPTAVTVKRRSVADLTHAVPAGFPVLGVIEVDLGGASLAGIGRLTLATEEPPAAGSRGLLLGTVEVDGEPRWRALAELEPVTAGWRTVASGGSNPPWPGIRQGGLYLALELEGDWGLLEGELFDTDQDLVAGGLITSAAVPWIQLSGTDGSYVIPLPAGAAVVVTARDGRRDQVTVEIPALSNGERRVLDIEVLPTGPTVLEIEPADGAANVPTTFLPRVRFSEPVDRATLATGIRLLRDGELVPIDIDHQNDRVVIDPATPLLPDTSYTLEVGSAIADLQGRNLVATRSVSFRTQVVEAPTPGIDASKVLLYEPDFQGLARVVGQPGAVPADSTLWVEAVATITVVAAADGSFELEIPATLGDDLFLSVLVPGQSAATRLLGPWLLRGDLGAYIGKAGGRFKTAAGIEVEVQRDSFEQLTKVRLELKPAPIATSSVMQPILDFELDLGGAVALKPLSLRMAAPNRTVGSTIFLSRYTEALGRRGWMVLDLLRKDGGFLTNANFNSAVGSVSARMAGVPATRFEDLAGRVLTAGDMEAYRRGEFLPKAQASETPIGVLTRSTNGLEALVASTEGQELGLPGVRVGGRYQASDTVVEISWLRFDFLSDLLATVFWGDGSPFMATMIDDLSRIPGLRWLMTPIIRAMSFEVTVHDLTTGYQLYRQVLPPSADPIYDLPPGNYADRQPPSIVSGSPLRFALIQSSVLGRTEVMNGISAEVTANSITITGADSSVSPDVQIRLFDIDTPTGDSHLQIQDAVVRSTASGSFVITLGGLQEPRKRFLLAIGGVVGPSDRLSLRFNEKLRTLDGIELHRIEADGVVNQKPVEMATSSLEGGVNWQLTPASGWRAGKYELWVTDKFGDNPGGEVNNLWKRKLALEFEVPRSSSAGNLPLTRFADFDRMANIMAVADNDGGLRLIDVSNPANPQPFLSGSEPYRFSGGGAVRGVAFENHGRVIVVGSGEQFGGQLHIIDPLAMDREAPVTAAWPSGVWGFTTITNPLGVHQPFRKGGLPRRVAAMNNDQVLKWQAGSTSPSEVIVNSIPSPGSTEKLWVVEGEGEAEGHPISIRNLTRGRFARTFADANSRFSISIKGETGDLLELRIGRGTWAYVSIDGKGIAMVNVEGARGGTFTEAASLDLVEYTNGFRLDAYQCDDSRPDVDPTPIDLDVIVSKGANGSGSATLVSLVQGYGLALYQIDPEYPGMLSELSSACAAVDRRALVAGMDVVGGYPMDLDGDGKIRERTETAPEGGVLHKEIRDYAVVANARGYVLIFDITDPAHPDLVSRIKIGKQDELVQISGVTIDRQSRKIYVGAFGRGLYSLDFNKIGIIGLKDSDEDGLDDRVTENIRVGNEELVDALAFPDTGVIWGGGRKTGAWSVAVAGPTLKLVAFDGGPIREVSRLAPLGVPTSSEGREGAVANYPAAFQAQVTVASEAPELAIEAQSLTPDGIAMSPIPTMDESLPPTQLKGEKSVKLERQAENPWEEGSSLYLSRPIVAIADIRSAISYIKTPDEKLACTRCDQIEEKLYESQPLPIHFLPEILSGARIAVDWQPELMPSLRLVYANLLRGPTSVPSVPWDMSPALMQEPALSPSTGNSDVLPGTLLHSGEFSHEVTDLAIPGLGFDYVFSRTYRSQTIGSGPLGPGWDHNWNIRLRPLPNGDVELYDGRGRRDLVYTRDSAKFVQLKPHVTLRPHSQGYSLTDDSGNHLHFDTFGRLLGIVNPLKTVEEGHGTEALLRYDHESRLIAVSIHGKELSFSYEDGLIRSVKDFSGREWRYSYDSQGRLDRVEAPSADLGDGTAVPLVTTYSYQPASQAGGLAGRLASLDDMDRLTDPRNVQIFDLDYELVPNGVRTRVTRQVLGDATVVLSYAGSRTSVQDRRGHTRHYDHDAYGHLTQATDPLGNVSKISHVDFEVGKRNGLIKEIELPGGRKTVYQHEQTGESLPNLRRLSNLKQVTIIPSVSPPGAPETAPCKADYLSTPFVAMKAAQFHEMTNVPTRLEGPAGNVIELELDEAGVSKSIVLRGDSQTLKVDFQPDSHGLPKQSTANENAEGQTRKVTTSNVYDPETGLLLSETILVGGKAETTTYEYDARGNVLQSVSPDGAVRTSTFNTLDWLLSQCVTKEGRSICTRYTYDAAGKVVEVAAPYGSNEQVKTRFIYGPLGQLLETYQEVKPGGPELKEVRAYDSALKLVESDPTGLGKTTFSYDARGLLASKTESRGGPEPITTTYSYDADGQIKTVSEGGQVWSYFYDGIGRKVMAEDPKGNKTYWTYDAGGNVTAETTCRTDLEVDGNENGQFVTKVLSRAVWEFDASGNLLSEEALGQNVPGSGPRTTYRYDNRGRVIGITEPFGGLKRIFYDEAGRVISEIGQGLPGSQVSYQYDSAKGDITTTATVGDQSVTSTLTYDAFGLPILARDSLGNFTRFEYDDARNLIRMQINNSVVLRYEYSYDALRRPLSVVAPQGISETYIYEDLPDSARIRYIDALKQETEQVFGTAGQLVSTRYPDQTSYSLSYDNKGNPIGANSPGLQVVQSFDEHGRLLSRERIDGQGTSAIESYTWDSLDRLIGGATGGKTTAWSWDLSSRLLSERQGTRSVIYSPHIAGPPEAIGYPSGAQISRGYDVGGWLERVDMNGLPIASFSRQGLGPTQAQVGPLTGQFQHDQAGRLSRILWTSSKGTPVVDDRVQLNAQSLPITRVREDLGQRWEYRFDNASRLESASQVGSLSASSGQYSYVYDGAQNLKSMVRTTACGTVTTALPNQEETKRNRPGSIARAHLSWDTRGRLIGKRDLRFEYDDRDRLIAVKRQIDEETQETLASYKYDVQGRRISRSVGANTQDTVWAHWQSLEDYQGQTLVGRRLYGTGYDHILKLELPLAGGGLVPYYPAYDYLGNLAALTREDGTVIERYDYDPYGRRTITGNDFQPPVIEQVRLVDGELRLQVSESSVKLPNHSNVVIQNLTRPEQPVLALASVLDPVGRQSGRLAVFKNGGDPEDDPPTWPSAGDSVRIVVASGAFVDSFGNNSAELVIESVTWPGDNGILLDQTPPRLEEICAEGGTVRLTFSEPVSAAAAANALQVDGGPATWVSQNQGYTLQVQLPAGPHQIQFGTAPLDLAGLGFSQVSTKSFATTEQTQAVFMAPFPGEAGASLVGNVYGFQGLPEDSETGFLYVRNRYYDPELGRFITPDPLGYQDGPNMYQFGLNNPIVNRDPTGEAVQVIPCAIAGAAAVGVGWAINNLFFEGDYDRTDAALDFTLGALTCGVGNLVKGTAALAGGTTRAALGRMAAVAGADAALGVGTEATRSFLNGEEISGAQLAMNAGLSLVSSFGVPAIMNRMNPCNCFAAGTPVATETGLRPIEQIKVGELVWALDEESGTPRLQKVVKVFANPAKETWDLDVRSEDGSSVETIKVTADHPFWLENQGWVAASSLKPGDRLRTNTDSWLEVSQLRGPPVALPVYNFEVEVDHSYYVGQGQLLVHNLCPVARERLLNNLRANLAVINARAANLGVGKARFRPTPRESELHTGVLLGPGYLEQRSFIGGLPAYHGQLGSVRPDFKSIVGNEFIEVKNYDLSLSGNRYRMYKTIEEQALKRLKNLPAGSVQKIVIDARGQIVDPAVLSRIKHNIQSRTGGIILSSDVTILLR